MFCFNFQLKEKDQKNSHFENEQKQIRVDLADGVVTNLEVFGAPLWHHKGPVDLLVSGKKYGVFPTSVEFKMENIWWVDGVQTN